MIRILRIFSSVFLLSFWAMQLTAQRPEVFLGPEEKLDSRRADFGFLGADEQYFYLMKNEDNRGRWTLEAYDLDSLRLRQEVTIERPNFGEGETELVKVQHTGSGFLMLHSHRYRSDGRRDLYITPINSKGQIADLPVKAGTIPPIRLREKLKMDISLSPDSSLIFFYYSMSEEARDEAAFELKVFSRDLSLSFSKTLVLPYQNEFLDIDRMIIDRKGRAYLLSGVKPVKSPMSNPDLSDENKRYLLFSFDFEKNKLKEFDVNLKDKWVVAVTFGITPDDRLAIGGFYSNDIYFSVGGTFYFTLDTDDWSVATTSMQPFDREFLRSFGNSRMDEGGRELYNYYFDHLIMGDDGSVILVAEQYYMDQRWFMDPGTGRQTISYSYNYNDIIAVSIDSAGGINWSRRVPKKQVTINDNGPYSSYALSNGLDGLNLVFNDNPRNYEIISPDGILENPASFGNLKKSVVTWVRIDPKGQMQRKALFSAKESETVFKPKVAFSQGSAELIVFSQLRRNFRFIRLDFDQ